MQKNMNLIDKNKNQIENNTSKSQGKLNIINQSKENYVTQGIVGSNQ